MLKALELNGFKSFADRTRFEFPSGITVVVGPNGSGKSNVVDAIKWVLGAQSVKALRGKEMTDVIFSGARSRGQTNSAEVSLIIDNSSRSLDIDSEEVQVTRRVYRSGEAEYLINRQPCRLRDIRDVFAGTGMSTGAYSIIEQGKVDALLQSSPRERRLIFEEAAGVSRFKIKRQEAARRLERVEQNLLRLSDIVDELESRLRSVRSQAGKARKYKQCSDRLKELRTQVSLSDWRTLSTSLQAVQEQAEKERQASEAIHEQLTASDRQHAELETGLDDLLRQMHATSDEAATIRERIAQCESTRRSQIARSEELQQESQRLQRQLLAMTSRVGDAQQLVAETTAELMRAENQFHELSQQVEVAQLQLDQALKSLADCRTSNEAARSGHAAAFREATRLENQIHVLQSERSAAAARGDKLRQRLTQLEASGAHLEAQFSQVQSELALLEAAAQGSHRELTAVQDSLRRNRARLATAQGQLADLRGRLTGARERAVVLEELERRLDGLSSGAKDVLRQAREQPDGPFGNVRGVVADLLRVDADTASLVEIALGERANHLLVERAEPLVRTLTKTELAGRTSFLRLDVPQPASAVDRIDLSGERGVMGRADQFVETAPELSPLARRLLGRYWFVDTLETALRLSQTMGRGLNFVTVVGEVIAADGTLVVGPRQANTGLLSRRSELRALVDEIRDMQQRIEQEQAACGSLEQAIAAEDEQQVDLARRHAANSHRLNEVRLQAASLRERLDQTQQQHASVNEELSASQAQVANASHKLDQFKAELVRQQVELELLQASLQSGGHLATLLEEQVSDLQRTVTDHRVELARSEQRRDGLRRQMAQLQEDHQEHDRALADTRERETECHVQRQHLEQSVLELSNELTELYRSKEALAETSQQLEQRHDEFRKEKTVLTRHLEELREQLAKRQSLLQQAELRVQQFEHQRTELAARIADDYGVNLALLATQESASQTAERETVDAEIRSLREQLQSIGPVNLEALTELEAVEERHDGLSRQYEDLRTAKARLEQLVAQINVESRELFVSALNVIRGHFQDIYRSLFGGGEADVVIDDSETDDVLESGIEIIARPPGKQLRNISLLSGGERTLTCVALLLAIFRSRPSPFCVLDEVDAALDEANIDRFSDVLRQFMVATQFIVVTHSKRTMSCADTLYGVTMQESGVSKRVSVRFEDVSADGHIRESAGGAQAA
jgi:chromosome segregation protein